MSCSIPQGNILITEQFKLIHPTAHGGLVIHSQFTCTFTSSLQCGIECNDTRSYPVNMRSFIIQNLRN